MKEKIWCSCCHKDYISKEDLRHGKYCGNCGESFDEKRKIIKMENRTLDSLSFSELEAKVKEMRNEIETVREQKDGPWTIGKPYLIRTVTMTLTGTLYAVFPQELVLDKACWIPDTGRFMEATDKGEFSEVEPWMSADSKVIIGRGAIVDAAITSYTVSRKQK